MCFPGSCWPSFLQGHTADLQPRPLQNRVGSQCVSGVAPLQGKGFAFPFIELCEIVLSPFLQPVQVPLIGSTILGSANPSSQLYIICRLGEGVLCPSVPVISKGFNQHWFQYQSLGTGLPPDLVPLITTFWTQMFSQVSTHLSVMSLTRTYFVN